MSERIVIGISGASGAIYGIRLLEAFHQLGVETHLIVSRTAQITIAHETPYSVAEVQSLASVAHPATDLAASISSGSFKTMGMVIAPCSMRSLAEIATSLTTTLLTRAADVTLKERRRLVLLPRETPLTLAHLRNMATVTEMGGIIAPPVPAFYTRPQSVEALVQHTVGRVMDLFGYELPTLKRWEGMGQKPQNTDG